MRIALVEDQKDLSDLVIDYLNKNGIEVDPAYNGEDALDTIDPELHDVIILDRGLPDMEGLEILQSLRDDDIKTPVLILTAKDGLGDKIEGLNTGADDYLVKPFEMEELLARLHALYRRPSETKDVTITLGNLSFSPASNDLFVNDNAVELSLKEKTTLEKLLRHPGKVITKDSLQTALYGYTDEGSANSVEVVMHRLRKKLVDADCSVEIKTLRGIGYMMKDST